MSWQGSTSVGGFEAVVIACVVGIGESEGEFQSPGAEVFVSEPHT